MEKRFVSIITVLSIFLIVSACNFTGMEAGAESNKDTVVRHFLYEDFSDVSYKHGNEFEYWDLLSGQGMMFYDALWNFEFQSSDECSTNLYHFDESEKLNLEMLEEAFEYFYNDHPEYEIIDFQVISRGIFSGDNQYENIGIYSRMNNEEFLERTSKMNSEIREVVRQVNLESNEVEKYRIIHDWIIQNVQYDFGYYNYVIFGIDDEYSPNCTNAYGAIVEKRAVCDGLADAFKYICQKCDLECISVSGKIDNKISEDYLHKWNIVKINEKWYLVDCTFDLSYEYEYFMLENLWKNNRVPLHDGIPGYLE